MWIPAFFVYGYKNVYLQCFLSSFIIVFMKNRLHYTFLLALVVLAGLILMYYLPEVSFCGKPLRKVDLLSDVRVAMPVTDSVSFDTLPVMPVKPIFIDSCKTGMECIEDYSDSTSHGMSHFYQALIDIDKIGRPVRIAYFGDSFIEGDIFTADLRNLLQDEFGGSGVGYVPMTSKFPGFRPTVRHSFAGWTSHNVTDTIGFVSSNQDISNNYFNASGGAFVNLECTGKYASNVESCSSSSFFYLTEDSLVLSAKLNGGTEKEFFLKGDSSLQRVTVSGDIKKVRWEIRKASPAALFYGVTMDSENGVLLDNFSTRGSSGQQLYGVPKSIMLGYDKLRKYDLVVIQYGLNVVFDGALDYTYYKEGMKPVISSIKEAFPETSILIIGIGDRESKDENGNLRTMPAVKGLIRSQQMLAAETGVAFWNLYNAMGGEGSIAKMVNSKPPMANYDYTHINFRGGRHLATLLFDAIMYGKEQYEKRKMYETE